MPIIELPSEYRRSYGDLARDVRHNLQASWILEAPFGKGKRWVQGGPAAQVLGGWQLSGVLSAHTGQRFTAIASNTSLNSQGSTQRADCLAASPKKLGIFIIGTGSPISVCQQRDASAPAALTA